MQGNSKKGVVRYLFKTTKHLHAPLASQPVSGRPRDPVQSAGEQPRCSEPQSSACHVPDSGNEACGGTDANRSLGNVRSFASGHSSLEQLAVCQVLCWRQRWAKHVPQSPRACGTVSDTSWYSVTIYFTDLL